MRETTTKNPIKMASEVAAKIIDSRLTAKAQDDDDDEVSFRAIFNILAPFSYFFTFLNYMVQCTFVVIVQRLSLVYFLYC